MKCEKMFNKACEENMNGNHDKAYDLFSEVVYNYPDTIFAIYANAEMTSLAARSAEYCNVSLEAIA